MTPGPVGSGPDRPAAGGGAGLSRTAWYALLNGVVVAWVLAAVVIAILQRGIPAAEWLLVHLLLLGAASSAIIVWSQHFADTLLRSRAAGSRVLLGARLAVHTLGAITVVIGVSLRLWPLVVGGGVLVTVAVLAQIGSMTWQLRRALPSRFGSLVRYYVVAGAFLIGGVVLGVLMARAGMADGIRDRMYLAHISFNLVGWVGLSVVGTVILLWPTVLHSRVLPTADAAARRALPFLTAGVLVSAAACLAGVRLGVSLGLLLYVMGLALVVVEAVRQGRQTPPATYAGWSMGAALGWFAGSVVALGVLVTIASSWADAAARLGALLAPLVVGFVAQLVTAALSYLLPVVMGGGPAGARGMNVELERFGVFRVIVVNGALLLSLLPLPDTARMVLVGVAAAPLLAFIPLAVRAIVVTRGPRGAVWPEGEGRHGAAGAAGRAPLTLHAASGSMMAAVGTLVVAVAVGVALAGIPVPNGPAVAAGTSSAEVVATGHTTTVKMTMKDMRFSPSTVRVPAGDRLVIELTNKDHGVHDLVLATGQTSGRLIGGESARVDAGVIRHDVDGWCSITGHRQLGMVMKIVAVGAAASETASGGAHDHGGMPMGEASGPSAAKDIDLAKKPSSEFTARDATLPPASAATVHRVTFTVRDTLTEVAPGVFQTLWTYNGTAPGPTLRGHVGDTFVVTLVNDGDMGHSIDFHAGTLAPDKPMRTIQPGQSLTYTFTATRSGIWLYHCSTMPMSVHIANGMYGAVIIDPPGLDPVAQEYVLVQSEYYLGPQKGVADASKVAGQKPDLVVFNGYADQYRYRPLTAKAGERIRVWVLDAGPNVASAFHIVGAQFDTVFEEGDYRLKNGGSTGTGGSQVLGMLPAQGGFVELTFPEAGDYPFVSHIMSDAEKGAAGTFHVSK